MDKAKLDEMRKFYHSLLGMKQLLDKGSGVNIRFESAVPLISELGDLEEKFPDLLPHRYGFKEATKEQHAGSSFSKFAIESWLTIAIARLQVELDDQTNTPITEHKEFAFINDAKLKQIIERDYIEIQKTYIADCWKSVIILCGGTIEAILTDLLIANGVKAKSAKHAPLKKEDITCWDLSTLIDVAVELDLVTTGVEKLSSPIREYRNLIHPGNEFRKKLKFGAEEARIALEVLNIVHRDLSTISS